MSAGIINSYEVESGDAPIPQVRQLDDLSVKPPPDEGDEQTGSVKPKAISTRVQASNQRATTYTTLADKIGNFSRELTGYLERVRCECSTLKQNRNFNDRREVANLRGAAKCDTRLNDIGEVIKNYADGHAGLGINQGWSAQAIHTAASYIFRNIYELSSRPFVIQMRGTKPEAQRMQKVLTFVLEDLLRKAEHEVKGHEISRLIPRYGTAEWRYEMTRPVYMHRDPETLAWVEKIGEPTPKISVWDSRLVFVTNPGVPSAGQQRMVFWVTEACTLPDIECEEAVFDVVPPPAPIIDPLAPAPSTPSAPSDQFEPVALAQVGGKYTGVELLRHAGYTGSIAPDAGNAPIDITARVGYERKAVNYFKPFATVECEGALPLSSFCGEFNSPGCLDPEVAAWFGIDVGFVPAEGDEYGFKEWKRRLDKIPSYRVAYAATNDALGNVQYSQANVICLLQCEPDRHKLPRNTLYVARYMPDAQEYYGLSITDLGMKLENGGDMIRNAQVWVNWFNSDPARLVDSRVCRSRKLQDVVKLFRTPGAVLEGAPSIDLTKAVQSIELKLDPKADQTAAVLKSEFEFTTGVSAAAKGQPGTNESDTLGEIQINEAKSQVAMNDLILAVCRELCRMYRHMIMDCVYFMGEEGFLLYAARCAGMDAGELRNLLPSPIDGIENEFDIQHPMSATQDTTVLASGMMRLFQLVGVAGFPDVQKFAGDVLTVMGYPRADELTQRETSMDPNDEHIQMRQGNMVEPKLIDDAVTHLQAHGALLEMLQPESNVEIPGMSDQERANLTKLLAQHVTATIQLMQMQADVAGLMAGPQGAGDPLAAAGAGNPAQAGGDKQRGVLDGQGGPGGGGGGQTNTGTDTGGGKPGGFTPMEQNTNIAGGNQAGGGRGFNQ